MSKKQLLLFIFVGSIALLIILLSILLAFSPQPSLPQASPTPQLSVAPSAVISEISQTKPAVPYSQKQTDKLLQKIANRTPLSENDVKVKQTIIAGMNQNSESVFVAPQFRVEYIKSPDVFMVEILDANIDSTKKAAVDWFLQKGFSPAAVCALPITFYLSPAVASQLKNTDTIFSPLAQGC